MLGPFHSRSFSVSGAGADEECVMFAEQCHIEERFHPDVQGHGRVVTEGSRQGELAHGMGTSGGFGDGTLVWRRGSRDGASQQFEGAYHISLRCFL